MGEIRLPRSGVGDGVRSFLRCPDCLGTLEDGSTGLTCTDCSLVLPVREGVPFAFIADDQERFLEFDDRRGKKRRETTPNRHHGGSYHWETYGFEDLLTPEMEGRVLLHGCGDAGERGPLEARGFEVYGFDVKRTGGTDFLGDAHRLPVADGSFDLLVSSQVLEHLEAPWTAASEIARVLKPGGWFVGSVAFLKPYHGSFFHMSHQGVVKLLEPAGLTVDFLGGAQSITYSMYGGMVPGLSRPIKRAVLGFFDRMLMGARAGVWSAKRRQSSDSPNDFFDRRFRFSFRAFDKLRYAPAVVFRAQKTGVAAGARVSPAEAASALHMEASGSGPGVSIPGQVSPSA